MRRRSYEFNVVALLVLILAGVSQVAEGDISITRFSNLVKNGDFSPAIQAAIDYVSKKNGFDAGATIYFPPGTYRIDHSIVVGNNSAHWGLHLIGYGATLTGSKVLDKQPLEKPEPEEKNAGVPILILKNPPGIEGAAYCIEGLRFTREKRHSGIAISIPWKEYPKGTSFRNIKVHNQNIGVHIKYAWQFYFTDCIFRNNQIGMVAQSQANNLGIVNCIFRRNHKHGLVIGPDRGQWASNCQHISGSIFESNKGYGILILSAEQMVITGCYFEANGNSIGVLSGRNVTIDTNLFWSSYGHGWRQTPYADNAHIVVGDCRDLRLRNNRYEKVNAWFRRKKEDKRWEYVPRPVGPQGVADFAPAPPKKIAEYEYVQRPVSVLVVGSLAGSNVFDTLAAVHQKAKITSPRIADDTGLYYYEYDPQTNTFEKKSLLTAARGETVPRETTDKVKE